MSDLNDLKMLLESRYPIVVIETWEELLKPGRSCGRWI